MSKITNIAWTESSFNVAWGCAKISPGCKNCYADTSAQRYGWNVWGSDRPRRIFGEKYWAEPLKWNRDAERDECVAAVFTSSMADVFEDHPTIAKERAKLWDLIRITPWLDWQVLTKRADRIKANLPEDWDSGYPNVWLGVSVEHDEYAWRFNDYLLHIPATVRFVSYEPALGPLTLLLVQHVDWLIYGGESGPDFRPDNRQWARDIRDQCRRFGTAFFHKQAAAAGPGIGVELDGEIIREFPKPRIQTGLGEPNGKAHP